MRIVDFARQYNISEVEILKFLKERGVKATSFMELRPNQIEALKKRFKLLTPKKVAVRDLSHVIIPHAEIGLGDFADQLGVPSSEVIVFFLKQGVIANRNHVLSKEQVVQAVEHFGASLEKQEKALADSVELVDRSIGSDARLPVVTVMGHVDHGKTTLLDYIRKAQVAEKEVGGITQHLGAYEVDTPHGSFIMLDTPGHEAFSVMRERGALVADLVILVVAADDGLMPQTRESIKIIKEFDLPVVVAINKADKAEQRQVDDVKRQLAEVDLLPDEWGGDVPCIAISAKVGTGMQEMLELVALQSEMLDLITDLHAHAEGYILESKLQRGRGPVGTLILHRGQLHLGDYIISKNSRARISSLTDYNGKPLQKVGPSTPVQVAGFEQMPVAGEVARFATAQEYKKWQSGHEEKSVQSTVERDRTMNLVVRAASVSSQQSLADALQKIKIRGADTIRILDAGVGNITETVIDFAVNTGAIIVGLDVGLDVRAQQLADKNPQLTILLHNIIYKLLEDIEARLEKTKEPEYEIEVVGSGYVKAIFAIKKVGKIAGVQVEHGVFKQGLDVQVLRNKKQIGEGKLTSLQQDRQKVQSVSAGNDCAFSLKEFEDWKEGDTVQCVMKTQVN